MNKIKVIIKIIQSILSNLAGIIAWLFYSVILSFAPFALIILFTFIVGYNIEIAKILPDYLLLIFSFSVSILGSIIESNKISKNWCKLILVITITFMVYCIAIYEGLFNEEFLSFKIRQLINSNDKLNYLLLGGHVILSFIVLFGIIFKAISIKSDNDERSNKQ